MNTLEPKAGFLWSQVKWGAPDERVSDECSYCGEVIPEESIPLRLWDKQGYAAQFCEACQREWWGLGHATS